MSAMIPRNEHLDTGFPMNMNDFAMAACALSDRIKPLLAGYPSVVQGGALADLVAIWLAGHQMADREALANFRETLLALHLDKVRQLIPVNEEANLERLKRQE